jgi:hypothetical protein
VVYYGAAAIRQEMAEQIPVLGYRHTNLHLLLEEHRRDPGALALAVDHVIEAGGESVVRARVMSPDETQRMIERLAGYTDRIIAESRQKDGQGSVPSDVQIRRRNGGRMTRGMKLLCHKADHAAELQNRDRRHTTRFPGLLSSKFNTSQASIEEMQRPVVERYIRQILTNPSTIIVHRTTIQIINDRGQGIRIENEDREGFDSSRPLLKGFIDTAFLFRPKGLGSKEGGAQNG